MRIRRLVWLRWTLLLRAMGVGRAQRIATAMFLLVLVPASTLLAWLTYVGYRRLSGELPAELLAGVLGLFWLCWGVGPVWSMGLSQGLDADRLQPYPLSGRALAVGLALGAMLDLWSLPVAIFFGAAGVAWSTTPSVAPVVVAALALAYLHQVALSQVVTNAFAGVLRSRRFRDAVVFLSAVIGSSFWLIQQAAFRNVNGIRTVEQLAALRPRSWLHWLPPGWAAEAILAARAGDWTMAGGWLLALTLGLGLLLWLWVWLTRRLGEVTAGGEAPRVRGEAARGSVWPPGRIWALARKDLRSIWRDPVQRAQLFTSLAPLIWLAAPVLAGGAVQRSVVYAPLLVALVPVWTARDLASNAFGWERGGLPALFALPVPPALLLLGKNLAVALVALIEAALLAVPLGYLARDLLPLAALALPPMLLVTLGTANVLAVLAPRPVFDRSRRPNTQGGAEGCAQGLIALGALALQLVLIAPAAAAIIGPNLLDRSEWLPLTLPLAYLYGLGAYLGLLRWTSTQLQQRGSEILSRISQQL